MNNSTLMYSIPIVFLIQMCDCWLLSIFMYTIFTTLSVYRVATASEFFDMTQYILKMVLLILLVSWVNYEIEFNRKFRFKQQIKLVQINEDYSRVLNMLSQGVGVFDTQLNPLFMNT